jgi:ribosomal protein S9
VENSPRGSTGSDWRGGGVAGARHTIVAGFARALTMTEARYGGRLKD